MMTSHFERFNRDLIPPAGPFYERELGKLTRADRKGWALGNCPFHRSKSRRSFTVNVTTGGFHCFGCGVHGGDLISFIRARDRCSFTDACKTLGIWRHVTPAERTALVQREQEREWNRQKEVQRKTIERRERLKLRDELHTAVQLYAHVDGELHALGPDAEEQWAVLPSLLEDLRMSESAYCRAARLENPYE